MATWRDELIEAVKTKAEREAEEQERLRKRIAEALAYAEKALVEASGALRFACDQVKSKKQPAELVEGKDAFKLLVHDQSLAVELARDSAVIKVTFGEGKPREFDFAKDRHIAPNDVEEYVGRRSLELIRAAQKSNPW